MLDLVLLDLVLGPRDHRRLQLLGVVVLVSLQLQEVAVLALLRLLEVVLLLVVVVLLVHRHLLVISVLLLPGSLVDSHRLNHLICFSLAL